MKLDELVARKIRDSFTFFIGKPRQKRSYSSDPGNGLMVGFYEYGNEPLGSVTGGEFLTS
jgi:hypothetical protein